MDDRSGNMKVALDRMLRRSDELHDTLVSRLDRATFDSSPRAQTAEGMCGISLEHGLSLRLLIASGCPISAVGLMRLQFEAVTRAVWLLYAASDTAIIKFMTPLTLVSEQAAKNLPSVNEMMKDLSTKPPEGAYQMLAHFKDVSWRALNSFVHGGIHPLRRRSEGFPLPLIIQVLQNSNALLSMAGMTLANLTGDESVTKPISRIQREFADCLPPLLK
jgi:hypothetical protein